MLNLVFKFLYVVNVRVGNKLRQVGLYGLAKVYNGRLKFESYPVAGRHCSCYLDWSNASIKFGNDCSMRNFCSIRAEQNGVLEIGNNVFFNNGCSVNCIYKITIGNDCQFGENVKIYDHNHEYRTSGISISKQGYIRGEVKIGNNCWIGSNVVVLKGVTIGDNVVVGAGCVVYKDVQPGTVLVGKQ